jgi:hypothetical protein
MNHGCKIALSAFCRKRLVIRAAGMDAVDVRQMRG